jgi:GT2 family glycosyltransferase
MKIASIILTYNDFEKTKKSINSLIESNLPNDIEHFIIVIDNCSSDKYIEGLKNLQKKYSNFEKIKFIFNKENLGFSGGNNVGISYALEKINADAVLLINNDAYLEKNTLNELLNFLFSDPNIGIVGPTICYYGNKDKIWHGGGFFKILKMGIINVGKNKSFDEISKMQPIEVDFISLCVALIKKEVFEKIGFLDQNFFLYYDDTDFCYRAKKAGFKLIYIPHLRAYHDIDEIYISRATPMRLYYLARSYFIFVKKHFNIILVFYSLILFIFLYTPFRIIQMIKGKQPILKGLLFHFKGARDGLFFQKTLWEKTKK